MLLESEGRILAEKYVLLSLLLILSKDAAKVS